MLDSTVNASHVLGNIGSVAAPKTTSHRTHKTGALNPAGAQSVADSNQASTSQAWASPQTETLSDLQIVSLVLQGDQNIFASLVERYKDAVQNLAYRMLGNTTEAEDITQETFVRAYTQLATYKPAHKFSTWLLSIASHLAIDQLRRRRFLALPLEDVPFLEWIVDANVGPEQSALQDEQHDEIQSYLQVLPSKYRAVIVLRYWYDFSYEEIAQALKLTPALVKARLHRARELLGRHLKKQVTQEEVSPDALQRG